MTHTDDKAYYEALENADREARATFAGALLVALFFWGAIALFKDSDRLPSPLVLGGRHRRLPSLGRRRLVARALRLSPGQP